MLWKKCHVTHHGQKKSFVLLLCLQSPWMVKSSTQLSSLLTPCQVQELMSCLISEVSYHAFTCLVLSSIHKCVGLLLGKMCKCNVIVLRSIWRSECLAFKLCCGRGAVQTTKTNKTLWRIYISRVRLRRSIAFNSRYHVVRCVACHCNWQRNFTITNAAKSDRKAS